MKTGLIIGFGLVVWASPAFGFVFVDPEDGTGTLPERKFTIREVRKTMSMEEMRIDERILRGELVLRDGRPVSVYAYDPVHNLIVGAVSPAGKISIHQVSAHESGREALVMFLNDRQEPFRPEAEDFGVWNRDFERINVTLDEVTKTAKRMHVFLLIDRSGSMKPFMRAVKERAKGFLAALPKGAKCLVASFNRLVTVHAGGNFHWVNYGGQAFDHRVRDLTGEDQPIDFSELYPEAIVHEVDQGNDTKLKEVITAGQWGIDCAQGSAYIDEIGEATGGTALFAPMQFSLRSALVSQDIPEIEAFKHIIVLVTDGGDTASVQGDRDEVIALKEKTGATVFAYWIGNTDRSALAGIVDYELMDQQQTQESLSAYLENIHVFIDGQQVLLLRP